MMIEVKPRFILFLFIGRLLLKDVAISHRSASAINLVQPRNERAIALRL